MWCFCRIRTHTAAHMKPSLPRTSRVAWKLNRTLDLAFSTEVKTGLLMHSTLRQLPCRFCCLPDLTGTELAHNFTRGTKIRNPSSLRPTTGSIAQDRTVRLPWHHQLLGEGYTYWSNLIPCEDPSPSLTFLSSPMPVIWKFPQ